MQFSPTGEYLATYCNATACVKVCGVERNGLSQAKRRSECRGASAGPGHVVVAVWLQQWLQWWLEAAACGGHVTVIQRPCAQPRTSCGPTGLSAVGSALEAVQSLYQAGKEPAAWEPVPVCVSRIPRPPFAEQEMDDMDMGVRRSTHIRNEAHMAGPAGADPGRTAVDGRRGAPHHQG